LQFFSVRQVSTILSKLIANKDIGIYTFLKTNENIVLITIYFIHIYKMSTLAINDNADSKEN